jgi:hypothetical protein
VQRIGTEADGDNRKDQGDDDAGDDELLPSISLQD